MPSLIIVKLKKKKKMKKKTQEKWSIKDKMLLNIYCTEMYINNNMNASNHQEYEMKQASTNILKKCFPKK